MKNFLIVLPDVWIAGALRQAWQSSGWKEDINISGALHKDAVLIFYPLERKVAWLNDRAYVDFVRRLADGEVTLDPSTRYAECISRIKDNYGLLVINDCLTVIRDGSCRAIIESGQGVYRCRTLLHYDHCQRLSDFLRTVQSPSCVLDRGLQEAQLYAGLSGLSQLGGLGRLF
jgi:hypothetical protein